MAEQFTMEVKHLFKPLLPAPLLPLFKLRDQRRAAEHPSRSHHSRDSGEARLCTFNVFRCPYITVENDRMRTCLEKITETVEIKVSPILLARNTRMKCHMFQRHV